MYNFSQLIGRNVYRERKPVAKRYARVDGNWASREYFSGRKYYYYETPQPWLIVLLSWVSPTDPDLPPPVRITIPRIRYGQILYDESYDDRARLLGMAAIMIAEVTNPVVHDLVRLNSQQRAMYVDDMYGIEPLPVDPDRVYVNYQGLDDLKEVMTMLLDYDIDTALAMIAAKVDQQVVNSHELSVFASFVDTIV